MDSSTCTYTLKKLRKQLEGRKLAFARYMALDDDVLVQYTCSSVMQLSVKVTIYQGKQHPNIQHAKISQTSSNATCDMVATHSLQTAYTLFSLYFIFQWVIISRHHNGTENETSIFINRCTDLPPPPMLYPCDHLDLCLRTGCKGAMMPQAPQQLV